MVPHPEVCDWRRTSAETGEAEDNMIAWLTAMYIRQLHQKHVRCTTADYIYSFWFLRCQQVSMKDTNNMRQCSSDLCGLFSQCKINDCLWDIWDSDAIYLRLRRIYFHTVLWFLATPSFPYAPPVCRVSDIRCIHMISARKPPPAGGRSGICLNILTPPICATSL